MGFLTFLKVPGRVVYFFVHSILLWVALAYVIQYAILPGNSLADDGYVVPQSALVYSAYALLSVVTVAILLYGVYLCVTKRRDRKQIEYVPLSADIYKV